MPQSASGRDGEHCSNIATIFRYWLPISCSTSIFVGFEDKKIRAVRMRVATRDTTAAAILSATEVTIAIAANE